MELTGDKDAWQISKHMENGIRDKESRMFKDQECFLDEENYVFTQTLL
jgi:hypothetical protein